MLWVNKSSEILEYEGDLALMLGGLLRLPSDAPVLLVSMIARVAYLRRRPGQLQKISGIDRRIMRRLRRAEFVTVFEMEGDRIAHSYDAPAGPLEYDEDSWPTTKAFMIVWRLLARCWTSKKCWP